MLVLVVGAVVLGVAMTFATVGSSRNSVSAATPDPLVGTWDTGRIPAPKLRRALVARGYANAKVTSFFKQFGIRTGYEFKIVFYRENGVPFLYRKGWDPSRAEPNDADHGPYTLLSNHRFVSRGVDPPTDRNRVIFSYAATSKRLTLRLLSLTEPGFSKADLALDRMVYRASEAFPYKRIP